MKELSIEEKAKRYDEAINTVRNLVKAGLIYEDAAIQVFPELKESEDEKVIRDIEVVLESSATKFFKEEGKMPIWYDRAIAWLEKQGSQILANSAKTCKDEQKPIENKDYSAPFDIEIPFGAKDSELIQETIHIPDGCYAFIEGNEIVIKKGENPAWSEEDELMLNDILMCGERHCYLDARNISWLKSLKDRCLPQSTQEWSERDEEEFQIAIDTLVEAGQNDSAHWLKSLKDRYAWKPSNEQIMALRWVLNHIPYGSRKEEISGLLEDLKKLREK